MIRATCSLFALASLALAQAPIATVPIRVKPVDSDKPVVAAMKSSRAIDLVICLDISGSMNGLINAARQNIWSIVNDMATLKPQPELRVALLTYGSPAYGSETGFVSIQSELTTDLDLVSQKLFALSTNGGSEYVARVVKRSIDDLKWSSDPQALKLIFVAGNEAATQDPEFDAMQMASMAIGKGILVNTIYCGDQQKAEAEGWRQVARMADGKFVAIEQDQIAVIETPFDKELMALSAQINTTYLTFGVNRTAWASNQVAQDSNALTLNSAAAAQRCLTKATALYFNPTHDLCDAVKNPKFDLAAVKKEDLPEELRKMTPEQLQAHVGKMQTKRDQVQKQVAEIGRQRDAYVKEERRKKAKGGETLFEDAILESVREQARSRGFERRPEPAVETLKVESPTVEMPKTVIVAPTPVVEVSTIQVIAPQVVKPPKASAVKALAPKQSVKKNPVDARFEKVIKDAVKGYEGFSLVTGQPKIAPTDCLMPGPFVRTSEASKQHGGKLYLLYARNADGLEYIKKDEPAKVGQTLVKEAWAKVKGQQQGKTEASKRYPLGLLHHDGKQDYHAGDSQGLFVMHKLAKGTEGTDLGWIYGTIDKNGRVTGAGKMASCIKCHVDAANDRRFGLR